MPKQDKSPTLKGAHNMPKFQQMQYAFAAWIRKPHAQKTPQNIERRRMDVYRSLFLNNVKNFVENAFPVTAQTLDQEVWQPLVEQFFEQHLSTSPYFREIPQEFMAWLLDHPEVQQKLPPWVPELLHYEWLELHVSTLDAPLPEVASEAIDLYKPLALSPFFVMAAYRWTVHEISPENQPTEMPLAPTLLAVYRTKDHHVRFMKLAPKAALLLEILQENPGLSPAEAAQKAYTLFEDTERKQTFALSEFESLFHDLQERDILLGQRPQDT